MLIKIIGIDPGIHNCGVALGEFDIDTNANGNTITSTYATITDTVEMTAAEVTAISSTILT